MRRYGQHWLAEHMDLVDIFPAFGTRIECGPVMLRALREADVPRVSELVAQGIHAEGARPFIVPWNLDDNQPLRTLQYYFTTWGKLSADDWVLMFAVERDGVMVGVQDIAAKHFAILRSAVTGSWLSMPAQGRGTGTLMRQAVLAFGFDHLGAVEMRSAAWADNANSHRVSEKCGYASNGYRLGVREGQSVREDQFVVTKETFVRPPYDLVVTGLDPFLAAVGLSAA